MIEIGHQIRIESEPQIIWGYLANVSNWGRWARVIKHAAIYGPVAPGTEFKCIAGKWDFDGKIGAAEANKSISFTGRSIGLNISIAWIILPAANATEVSTHTKIDGWFAKLFASKIRDGFDESIRIWLNSLKIAAEQGKMLPVEEIDDDDSDTVDNRTIQFTDSLSLLFRRKKSGK
jgi:hypothetical protein